MIVYNNIFIKFKLVHELYGQHSYIALTHSGCLFIQSSIDFCSSVFSSMTGMDIAFLQVLRQEVNIIHVWEI